ncbi:MAG: hypothetical protein SFW67_01515 [Myxococcaceae bacterium]|nr:hypothetical protein [Myxococcaceae bacterium]
MSEPRISSRRSLRQRLRRGQSMVEYSVVSHAILLIGGTSMLGVAQYLRLFQSLDIYLRSIYTVLRMGGI